VSDKDDKTEKPTPKRAAEARKKGNIPKSAELVSWIAIYAGASVIRSTTVKGGRFLQQLMGEAGELMAAPDQIRAMKFMTGSITGAFKLIVPLAITFAVIGIIGHLAQVRFVLATQSIKPSFSKINPLKGAKNLLGPQSLFQAAKQLIKLIVLSYVAYRTLWDTVINLSANGPYSVGTLITITGAAVMQFVKQVALVGVLIGILDYLYQRRKVGKGLKMSKEDVRQESKGQESSPEVRGKMRQRQRQMSQNRMMASIKDADVVIVNPVHVAVALTYDAEKGAPKVVAKGAGFVAEKIRERAEEHDVLMIQDVPLARTLHQVCEVDDEIPAELFEGVARLLAFVFALKAKGSGIGQHKMPGTPDVEEYERDQAREAAAEEAKAAAEQRFGTPPATAADLADSVG